jgi:lipopolysaccharide heptosyltransferase II
MIKTVVRIPNHLGDVIMAQGAVKAFAEWSPDSDIYLLLPEWAMPVYQNVEYVKYLPLMSKDLHGFSAIVNQVKLLVKHRFGVGIVLTPSFSSALIMSLSGVMSRYGYDGEGRGILLNNKLPLNGINRKHRSERYIRLLEHASGHKLSADKPHLTFSEQNISETKWLLKESGIEGKIPYIAVGPQSVAPSRCWEVKKFSQLIGKLNLPTVLIGTADEFDAGQAIVKENKNAVNLCGQTDIATAGIILSMAKLYIGNDSGLAHLAGAVDTPLVVLFGAGQPQETSPIADQMKLIIKDELDCISCKKNDCRLNGDDFMQCMKRISVEEVYQAALENIQL